MSKIYFWIVLAFNLFSFYYQYFVAGVGFSLLNLYNWTVIIVLLLGGFSTYYKRHLFEAKIWRYLFKVLIVGAVGGLLFQFWPDNYIENFSFLNGHLMTNIFVYLVGLALLMPFYIAVYNLSRLAASKSAKKKKKSSN